VVAMAWSLRPQCHVFRARIMSSRCEFGQLNEGGVVFEIDNRVPDLALEPDVELHVLQIVREALSNVVRHSHARRCNR